MTTVSLSMINMMHRAHLLDVNKKDFKIGDLDAYSDSYSHETLVRMWCKFINTDHYKNVLKQDEKRAQWNTERYYAHNKQSNAYRQPCTHVFNYWYNQHARLHALITNLCAQR